MASTRAEIEMKILFARAELAMLRADHDCPLMRRYQAIKREQKRKKVRNG